MKNTFAIIATAALLAACSPEKTTPAALVPAVPVTLGGATTGQQNFVAASGKIESANSANLSTRMMGYVTKLHVATGQKVSKGQLLVSINNQDLQAKNAQTDAAILQAKAAYDNAKKDYDRFMVLFSQQSASQKELDDMTSRYEMAKAQLDAARQMKNEVRAQFSYSNITAPFDGEVTGTFVKPGDMANPGMPLVSVEGQNQMQVTAAVAESDIAKLKSGMPAKILVKSTGVELDGKVIELSTSARNTGGQYLVKINLRNPPKSVLSGMFANVRFPVEASAPATSKILVPTSALVRQGQLTGIYVAKDNTALLRWLRTGRTYGSQTEVLSGLEPSEKYIVGQEGKLYNGCPIEIR